EIWHAHLSSLVDVGGLQWKASKDVLQVDDHDQRRPGLLVYTFSRRDQGGDGAQVVERREGLRGNHRAGLCGDTEILPGAVRERCAAGRIPASDRGALAGGRAQDGPDRGSSRSPGRISRQKCLHTRSRGTWRRGSGKKENRLRRTLPPRRPPAPLLPARRPVSGQKDRRSASSLSAPLSTTWPFPRLSRSGVRALCLSTRSPTVASCPRAVIVLPGEA
ncbi:unnamed protein product, partial [Amoebophrya sp. A120]